MGEKIVVGPINQGFKSNRRPFVIDNDSFPTLINAYQWRGRVKRKRGTTLLARLTRFIQSLAQYGTYRITLDGSGNGNLLMGLETNSSVIPGILLHDNTTSISYIDTNKDGILYNGVTASGTINYASGAVSIPAGAGHTFNVIFSYNPNLPVMGLEDFNVSQTQFPGTLAFDTTYSYNIPPNVYPYVAYDVSFYNNPATGTYPNYTAKPTFSWTPTTWNGQDYQQFWTTNYQGALWATNGIDSGVTLTTIGMQFKTISGITIVQAGNGVVGAGNIPAIAAININGHGLVQGDFVFINEVNGITGINFQTGYVTTVVDANNIQVTFPYAILGGVYSSSPTPGIAQYLTNRSNTSIDCLRWYNGDPKGGSPSTATFVNGVGWVNFMPPLFFNPNPNVPLDDAPLAQYYLVGARIIVPFKDRLLFFGPVIQTSTGNPIYLQDAVIYSQNGTPYYTSSFNGAANLSTTVFNPILVPANQTATANAYFVDQTGFGGYISFGSVLPILTVGANQDSLIVGFASFQTKLIYTSNDVEPFLFYLTNSELGSGSTFSSIVMDEGVITRGNRGYLISDQTSTRRIDLDNPDQVFQTNLVNQGSERFTAQRDFINEWIYFTYPSNESSYIYPNQTFLYNYADNSWAIFNECYTTYGQFRPARGITWNTAPIWNRWTDPWNSGSNTLFNPFVIGGNQQGFVLIREDEETEEDNSLWIQNISGQTITSPNHCLNVGDYIIISGAIGTVASQVNGKIFQVQSATTNTFTINVVTTGTYSGLGLIVRMYIPFIQTKQFPVSWGFSRKTRLGPQQYLFTTTTNAQIQLLIFLSQNADDPYNLGPIVPSVGSINDSLVNSTVLYTCPESTNLGLTPSNINLQMVTAVQQQETWHRMNTSLLGDTVQIGFTLSNDQMTTLDSNGNFVSQFAEIELLAFILDVSPSQLLA